MFPFHKLYLRLFESLDFSIERDLLHDIQESGVEQVLTVKRSWIYGLKITMLALLAGALLFGTAYFSFVTYESFFGKYILTFSYIFVAILFLSDSIWYLIFYKRYHQQNCIMESIESLIEKSKKINVYFIKFFNLSVFCNVFLLFIILETIIFALFFYQGDSILPIIIEITVSLATMFLIASHRRQVMNLELDFGIVVPGRFYVIDQTGLLSSKQTIVAQNIKTIEGVYKSTVGSFFKFGDIKIFLEGNIPGQKGVVELDYIRSPRKVVDLINKILYTGNK